VISLVVVAIAKFKWKKKMLQFLLTMAFSAVPLLLYIPPIRNLNTFVETIEEFHRESRPYTNRFNSRLQLGWSRIMNFVLSNTR
jgi:hypothetical protein